MKLQYQNFVFEIAAAAEAIVNDVKYPYKTCTTINSLQTLNFITIPSKITAHYFVLYIALKFQLYFYEFLIFAKLQSCIVYLEKRNFKCLKSTNYDNTKHSKSIFVF